VQLGEKPGRSSGKHNGREYPSFLDGVHDIEEQAKETSIVS